MEKIYQQENTGVMATFQEEATFFKPVKVLLEIHYARTKEQLEAGKEIHVRQHEIEISDDLLGKLLSIHSQAKEEK